MGEVRSGEAIEIELLPETEEKDVHQCLAMICNTIQGTVPFMRGFGISGEYMHRTGGGIENDIAEDVADQIEKYEKRVEAEDLIFDSDNEKGILRYTIPYSLISEEVEEDE